MVFTVNNGYRHNLRRNIPITGTYETRRQSPIARIFAKLRDKKTRFIVAVIAGAVLLAVLIVVDQVRCSKLVDTVVTQTEQSDVMGEWQ
jgi:hypothetical protein